MTAYELYKAFEKKFEEDPAAKDLPVNIKDNEWGEMEAEEIKWRPPSICTGAPMNMVVIE
jgi:TPP-dependent indolepyruvate ferredoxin oxidoreductase alpha subunit